MSSTSNLVHACQLTKRFDQRVAVNSIDFAVAPGEFVGFLGPNGAGKTSTMRMIGCVSPASSGDLRVLGMNPASSGRDIRSRLGVVPQRDILDGHLTVEENIYIYGRYFDLPRREAHRRAAELLDFVELSDRANDLVDDLSGGMKRRLVIARGLVNEPDLMLLDEPTTGLDPQARHLIWGRLRLLRRQGVTQILTTHFMDEAEQLCDRIIVMDAGRIIASDTPRSLLARYSSRDVVELHFGADEPLAPPDELRLVERHEQLADRLLLYTPDGDLLAAQLHDSTLRPESVLVRRATLEDVFLRLTGRGLVE